MLRSITKLLNPIYSLSIELNQGTLNAVRDIIKEENGVIKSESTKSITASITHGLTDAIRNNGSTGRYRITAKAYDDLIKVKIVFLDHQLFIYVFSSFCIVIFITSSYTMYQALVSALLAPYVGKLMLPISSARYWKNRFGKLS